MPRILLLGLILCFLGGNARALPFTSVALSPGEQCRTAIAAAEKGHGVPAQLLSAIGRIESGRRDPGTGLWGAWPWTINAEGQGSYFGSKAEAIQAVEALKARGVRSIDVGCMQVNLKHHPTAFVSLDMAFEPAVNADYAARFLLQLYGQTGDWTKATANYHSANPSEGGPYASKVTSIWPEEQRKAGLAPTVSPPVTSMTSVGPAFPVRQPARLFAMAGLPPVMMPSGSSPLPPPGSMASPPTAQTGPGLFSRTAAPGRGLDFYRSMPIRQAMPVVFTAPSRNGLKIR